jgi:hypothetical protein
MPNNASNYSSQINGFEFGVPAPTLDLETQFGSKQEDQYYQHGKDGDEILSDLDIKMNEFILHTKPKKLMLYQNHLFNVMQPRKTQIDINIENLPIGIHYTHILEFFKFNGIKTEPKQIYIKVKMPKKDKCTINCYNNYELAWKIVNLLGVKFSGKITNIELPDYEKSHKPRSNTFDEFCKEFETKLNVGVVEDAPRKYSNAVSIFCS